MRLLVLFAAVPFVGCGLVPECESFNDCEPGLVCSADKKCIADPRPDPLVCQPGGDTEVLLPYGLPLNSRHWICDIPTPDDRGAQFTAWSGPPAIVNGGSVLLQLQFTGVDDLGGRTLVWAFEDDAIVFTKQIDADRPHPSPFPVELFAARNAPPGFNMLRIGIENGESDFDEGKIGVGPYLEIPMNFIPVRGGDVQVSISWDNSNDVDLHVLDPDGFRIYFGDRTSPSGGQLDLDSNVGCNQGPQNENIFWETGTAPPGNYTVELHLYTACTTSVTNVRVNVLKNETNVQAVDVGLVPEETGDGTNPYKFAISFDWP